MRTGRSITAGRNYSGGGLRRAMDTSLGFYGSSIGKKMWMAVTGIIMFLFVFVHMIGNLQIYIGPEALNRYGHFLHSVPEILWPVRITLLACVLVHIVAAVQVWYQSYGARGPVNYKIKKDPAVDYAARTMVWSGPIVLLFIIFHLMHLTLGSVYQLHYTANGQIDVYRNVVSGFQHPGIAIVYIVANLLLGFHLYHGLWSLFQTMGWSHPRFNHWRRIFAIIFAYAIAIGNISIPVSVWAGWVH